MASSGKILKAIIFGAPGSGKGTISSWIARDFNLMHISSGDILRNEIHTGSNIGKLAAQYIHEGQLIPDPTMISLFHNTLEKLPQCWLLDGFPRTLGQAEGLSEIQTIDLAINLDVPFKTIRDRLEKRWIHEPSGRVYHLEWSPPKNPGVDDVTGEALIQRDDDTPETVSRRLKLYEELTKPLLAHYEELGVLKTFNGTESKAIYPKVMSFLTPFYNNFHQVAEEAM